MKLGFSVPALMAALLVGFSSLDDVDARPALKRANPITLPLKRIHTAREDLHPQILLQQHINRGHKRLAHMSGSEIPSDEVLRENLHKRMYIMEHEQGHSFEKRFNRVGLPGSSSNPISAAGAKAVVASGGRISADELVGGNGTADASAPPSTTLVPARPDGTNAPASPATTLIVARPEGTDAPAPGDNSTDTSDPNATVTATLSSPAADPTASAAPDNSNGFSEVALQAAQNGGLTPAKAPDFNNSLGLDIEANDVGYVATIQIGTPPRDFRMLMDSGSADTWVGSENCRSTAGGGCGEHTFLGPQSSSTFQDSQQPFAVQYGSGNVAGTIVADNIVFAGLTLENHVFGVADVESPEFAGNDTTFDGLVGTAQSGLSNQGVLTPIEALAQANLIPEAITSYKLGRVADGDNDGEVTFGALNPAKFVADTLVTLPNVNPNGFWEAPFTASIGGQSLGLQNRTAILDTGTTLIIAPQQDAEAIHAAIPGSLTDGQGQFAIPCTTNTVISMEFGGQQFEIDPRDLTFVPLDPNDLKGMCLSGISGGQIGGPTQWLIGDVFLKNAYFSHDVTKNTLSLAKLA